ncbi:stalk domain-containing protein [Peptoanaerobacter stomatis]
MKKSRFLFSCIFIILLTFANISNSNATFYSSKQIQDALNTLDSKRRADIQEIINEINSTPPGEKRTKMEYHLDNVIFDIRTSLLEDMIHSGMIRDMNKVSALLEKSGNEGFAMHLYYSNGLARNNYSQINVQSNKNNYSQNNVQPKKNNYSQNNVQPKKKEDNSNKKPEANPKSADFIVGSKYYNLYGEIKKYTAAPIIDEFGMLLIPSKMFAEALGLESSYNNVDKTVTLSGNNKKATLSVKNNVTRATAKDAGIQYSVINGIAYVYSKDAIIFFDYRFSSSYDNYNKSYSIFLEDFDMEEDEPGNNDYNNEYDYENTVEDQNSSVNETSSSQMTNSASSKKSAFEKKSKTWQELYDEKIEELKVSEKYNAKQNYRYGADTQLFAYVDINFDGVPELFHLYCAPNSRYYKVYSGKLYYIKNNAVKQAQSTLGIHRSIPGLLDSKNNDTSQAVMRDLSDGKNYFVTKFLYEDPNEIYPDVYVYEKWILEPDKNSIKTDLITRNKEKNATIPYEFIEPAKIHYEEYHYDPAIEGYDYNNKITY